MDNFNSNFLLRAEDIRTYFPIYKGLFIKKKVGYTKAVDGVSLSINSGETIGLVGESGCGKSTFAKSILRLLPITSGKVWFQGVNLCGMYENKLRKIRKDFQIVFQDPYASLNPRMTVRTIIAEPLKEHAIVKNNKLADEVIRLLDIVGLSARVLNKFPHEFSGGQRQRIAIARALALRPKLLVADEPLSALDVSIQAQILNLISTLQKQMGLSLLFISHNLAVIRHICSKVAVMYAGKIVEYGKTFDIFENPQHHYTKTLIKSIPIPDPDYKDYKSAIQKNNCSCTGS